jgi:hypothetical protein
VIAVFTKYDQFKLDVEMKLEDEGRDISPGSLEDEIERIFNTQYLDKLREASRTRSESFVRLEREGFI